MKLLVIANKISYNKSEGNTVVKAITKEPFIFSPKFNVVLVNYCIFFALLIWKEEIDMKENDVSYIIVAVKEKNDLENLLNDLKEYIVPKTDNSQYVLNHNLVNITTYIGVKKGYTKILSDYWYNDKIHVDIVASKTNKIATEIEEDLTKKNLNKYGFIIIKSNQLLDKENK